MKTCFGRVSIFNFCHQMQNVGQSISVAGPLFVRMVLAVILAVTVYSKQWENVQTEWMFLNGKIAWNCRLNCLLNCLSNFHSITPMINFHLEQHLPHRSEFSVFMHYGVTWALWGTMGYRILWGTMYYRVPYPY